MHTIINILSIVMLSIFGISCDDDKESYSEEFFYGVWNQYGVWEQSELPPPSLTFYYTHGFDFRKDGVCYPRYDNDGDGIFVTAEYAGSWTYNSSKMEITFNEEGSEFPKIYEVQILSENKIKMINPITAEEYLFERQ